MQTFSQTLIGLSWRLAIWTLPLLAVLLIDDHVFAQPLDLERYYQRTARELQDLDRRISQTPDQPELYAERAKLYLVWFQSHPEIVEHKGIVYATQPGSRAFADIQRAIELDPRGDYFTLRGRYYQILFWQSIPRDLNEKERSWQDIERLYWQSEPFSAATENYEKGLEKTLAPNAKAEAFLRLSHLYLSRGNAMAFYTLTKVVRAANKSSLVFEDFDRAIELTKKYARAAEPKGDHSFQIRDLYRDKARAAVELEQRPVAIASLSEGIEVLQEMRAEDEICPLYVFRGDLHARNGDFTAALRDYSYPLENKFRNCFYVYEKRGDVHFATGQIEKAIADFTQEISASEHPLERVYFKRGRAYLAIGNAEKAETDLSHVLRFGNTCSEPRALRARAYRLLKKHKLAEEDEKIAETYARNQVGCTSWTADQ